MENINKYYIKAFIDVHDRNYAEGDLAYINSYNMDSIVIASNQNEAIKEFFDNTLCFNVNLKYLYFDFKNNCFNYNVLCDVDNYEVLKNTSLYKEWIKGKINLYSNDIQLFVYELNLIKELNKIDKTIDN